MNEAPTDASDRTIPASPAAGRPARYDRRRATAPTVSVIVPTYDEADNIVVLIDRLRDTLADLDHEIIVVDDDSPDGTWQLVEELRAADPRIHLIRRTVERGLSSAVMTGMASATGRTLAVIDADLQHDETALVDLVSAIVDDGVDVAVGSREAEGGSYGDWGAGRRLVSWGGATLARQVVGVPLGDPMSGYFAVSRERYDAVADIVNPRGFKILLEFVARGPRPRVAEIGYGFRQRVAGETKLSSGVVLEFLLALIDLLIGRVVSSTLTAYAMVGASGLAVRLVALAVLAAAGWGWAGLAAFQLSVLWNFWWNNRFTFATHRRRGAGALVRGLLLFQLVSWQGWAVATSWAGWVDERLGVAGAPSWAGLLSGLAIATVFNYHLNRSITWRSDRVG